jgi:hypothetical protein
VNSVLALMLGLQIVFSRLWSPLIFLPAYINTVSLTVGLQPDARRKGGRIVAAAALAFLIPIALEAAGVLAPTWVVANDSIRITSTAVELGNAWSMVLLLGGNLVLIVVNAVFGRSAAMARYDAQRDLAIQAWHLRQMLPA